MSKILLEEMEFFAYHGCFAEEQIIGNRFIVHLEITVPTDGAQASDKLLDTLNYQEAYNVVRGQMTIKSHLLEHLGKRILDALMDQFPQIQKLKLRISKMNPPMGGKMKCVSVELKKRNP